MCKGFDGVISKISDEKRTSRCSYDFNISFMCFIKFHMILTFAQTLRILERWNEVLVLIFIVLTSNSCYDFLDFLISCLRRPSAEAGAQAFASLAFQVAMVKL